ncbi:unnamed protein product [Bursaphelenchus okinawaensis]|uniref:Small ribosomal subunit protein mS25 n=1 Tax=Bursaphelenchus okinawaensis TaxID=465554 RepID=A0A811JT42_9BILA|nr:unnamed protein product [Bursaphelenchus okinawaensis]CAG9081657.1 unnamed protein product [Bursaphelenchus okinawaensis]
MPFMKGNMPIRRTFYYLQQGKVILRDDVDVMYFGIHRRPTSEQQGAKDFVFWHFAQLQYKNPQIQLIKKMDVSITPFAQAFLRDGREVMFDLESKNKDEITNMIQGTLGKTELVKRREFLERMQDHNPAEFGSKCSRQCMCEVQGQICCTSLLPASEVMQGKWRWNHKLI